MRRTAVILAVLALAALAAGCGSGSSSSSVASRPDETYVQRLDIHPRPPQSAIPVARRHLREALALKKSPGSLEATIRRNELLTDVLYQVGRCREHEARCDDGRWERIGARVARSIIFWGYALGTGSEFEASRPSVHRTTVERRLRHEGAAYGVHSPAAREWGLRLLALELKSLGLCKGIPTCPYEKIETRIAALEKEIRPEG